MASVNSTSGSTPPERGELGAYVQFGCGICAPTTWLNFDAGPAFWIERKLPFLKPALPGRGFPDYPANISQAIEHRAARPARLERAVYRSPFLARRRPAFSNLAIWTQSPFMGGGDFKNMARELEAAGFTDIRRAQCRDNPEPRFHDVEEFSR